MQAIGYIRVSTDEQRLSPQAQAQAIQTYAHSHQIEILAIAFDHGLSGATPIPHRPGLALALSLTQKHRASLLIAKHDRLARDPLIALTVERSLPKGASLLSADGTGNGNDPNAQFMRGIIREVASLERALIRQRTKSALAILAQKGKRNGTIPYGYTLSQTEHNTLIPDPREQAAIALITSLDAQGYSLRAIVRTLASRGIKSRKGTPLGLTQVARILAASHPRKEAS